MSDIIVKPKNLPADFSGVDDFWDAMSAPKDRKLPMVRLGQGASTGGQEPGMYCWNTGRQVAEIKDCRVLYPGKGRTLFDGTKRRPALCGSKNWTEPSPRFKNPFSNNCLRCPLSDWDPNKKKEEVIAQIRQHESKFNPSLSKPLCQEKYQIVMYSPEVGMFCVSFFSSNMKIFAEKVNSKIQNEFPGIPPFAVSFTMGAYQPVADEKIFRPSFKDFAVLEGDEVLRMHKIYSDLKRSGANDKIDESLEDMDRQNAERPVGDDDVPF